MKNVVSKNGVWKTAPLNDTPGGGALVVTDTDGTLDKTWQEIRDAMLSGGAVISGNDGANLFAVTNTSMSISKGMYYVDAGGNNIVTYSTDSASGYPTMGD